MCSTYCDPFFVKENTIFFLSSEIMLKKTRFHKVVGLRESISQNMFSLMSNEYEYLAGECNKAKPTIRCGFVELLSNPV